MSNHARIGLAKGEGVMAEEKTSMQPSAAQQASGPSSGRRSVASLVQIALLVIFGGAGYVGVWALMRVAMLEDVSAGLAVALFAGGLIVGVIVGGILGAKAKKALLK